MNRAFVFIDGSNFYFKIKDLLSQTTRTCKFDFRDFAEWLVKPNQLIEIRYYLGAITRERGNIKSEKLYANQQRLLANIQNQNIIIKLGQVIRHPDHTYHEKGVDVRLAVEMIRFAREDKYDIAYLISSDTDLVAAIEEVGAFNKVVQYVGFPKGQSFGLSKAADDVRLLRAEDIERFLPKSPP